jgi:hypothetical protein
MLLAQCPILLSRVLELIEKINHELLLVRLAKEAIERADEVSSCVRMFMHISMIMYGYLCTYIYISIDYDIFGII